MFYSNKYPKSVFRELQDFPYSKRNRRAIFDCAKGSEDLVQRLKLLKKLPIHNGCVNCICWNEKGNKILSGSDDQHLIITDPFSYQVLAQYRTYHRANIFSAKFLPNTDDTGIVSCCGDGSIFYTDLNRIDETQDCLFNCHAGTTYDVVTIPNDPNVFLSCGEDYTVRSFDLRVKNKCSKAKCKEDVIIQCQRAVTALTVNNLMPCQIAIGCADSTARIYDRRMVDGLKGRLSPVDAFIRPGLERKPYRITSLNFSPEGEDLLVSYSSEHVYLFGLKNSKDMVFSTESLCNSDDEEGGIGMWCSGEKADSVPIRRLRLRGDWSDTGPDARPHSNTPTSAQQGGRRVVQGGLIQRMTDVLSRMLNDPATRAALSQGGEAEASDQVQLEEGLGEYLGMDRRPSEGNTGDPAVSAESSDGNVETAGEVGENRTEPNIDVPSHDESRESADVSMEESRVSCGWDDISIPEVRDSSIDAEPSNSGVNVSLSSQPIAPIETRSPECSTSMETENPASDPLVEPVEVDVTSRLNETPDIQSDDDHISPIKRAKDERSSPFDDIGSISSSQAVPSESPHEQIIDSQPDLQESVPESSGSNQNPSPDRQEVSSSQNQSSSSDHNVPSTSRTEEDERAFADSSRNSNLTDLTDELSTMFNGFKEKYGKKPMVNLVYSVRGSTASTISMSMEDNNAPNTQASQEAVAEVMPEVEPIIEDSPEEPEIPSSPLHTSEEIRAAELEPSTSTIPAPEPSASYTPARFAVRMEKELCKAIRKSRGEDNQDESVRLKKANIRMKYTGHRNARTMIKEATFWGSDYVMSGSDCGHVFIWTRDTGRLVMTLQADNHVVNCLQPHPTLPILATSGIDYDLKLWAPLAPEPAFDFGAAQELMNRNAIMLEETKDTITVPASFMIRMLACLNQLRRGLDLNG